MANKLDAEARMTIKALVERGHKNRASARLLGVHENAVRYHRRGLEAGAVDGEALSPLPILPKPFDVAVSRTVAVDATVGFEQRRYSVPFAWVGRRVEIRGASERVQILAEQQVVAVHPRHTPERI